MSILILDFGSQVTQLIARRVRELGVYCEIFPYSTSLSQIQSWNPSGIILGGGPNSIYDNHTIRLSITKEELINLNIPILGICYGQQLLTYMFGGTVSASANREYGKSSLAIIDDHHPLCEDIPSESVVWMSHGDKITALGSGIRHVALTKHCPYAIIEIIITEDHAPIYGLQFHPEVTHSEYGAQFIFNFVIGICKARQDWNMPNIIQESKQAIIEKVGDNNVIAGVSGGVDSTVASTLLSRAIGKQLYCIFIDHGMLRKNEAEEVQEIFEKSLNTHLIYVDAKDIFLQELENISDPEEKRKIIGRLFIEIFEKEAAKIPNAKFLMQGTIYPDVIESFSIHSDGGVKIKSHHNAGGLPEKMNLQLIEPLRELFKDEVRKLGVELDLPKKLVFRHPFPGPGLAIRILGEITQDKIKILQEADYVYISALHEYALYDEIWQAFATLLPVKTVGVMGDNRTYEYVCALRAVTSNDGMTASCYKFDPEFLEYVSNEIINSVSGINRVVYDITSKPPGTIEWE